MEPFETVGKTSPALRQPLLYKLTRVISHAALNFIPGLVDVIMMTIFMLVFLVHVSIETVIETFALIVRVVNKASQTRSVD